jgi:hypothetical protein
LPQQLTELPEADRERVLIDVVRSSVATVLGHTDQRAVDPGLAFKELGFDSLTALELRNRLNHVTGLKLSSTLIFDHPTPADLAGHLMNQIAPAGKAAPAVLNELARLEAMLAAVDEQQHDHDEVADRLKAMLWRWNQIARPANGEATGSEVDDDLDNATDDELFDTMANEFGLSLDGGRE